MDKLDRIVAKVRSDSEERDKSYRERALKMYPWICGRCAREFSRVTPDGSNWELLCVYCHDNEHSRYIDSEYAETTADTQKSTTTHNPFADLAAMLKEKK